MKKINRGWVIIWSVVALISLNPKALRGQQGSYILPGDIKMGWKVFYTKGCINCHSIWGQGGNVGPDLSKASTRYMTAAGIVAEMWNHGPGMWEQMKAKGIGYQKFSEEEMANLFAFLYFIRYTDEPGDPERGREVLKEKKCDLCHGLEGKGGKVGPDLAKWSMYTNPIVWAQMMWNHAPKMKAEMEKRKISWPIFKGKEMVDLIAYIRSTKPAAEKVYLAPGDPVEGKSIFARKGCIQCHAVRGEGGSIGPDLGQRKQFPPSMSQFAGLMWNHFPTMWEVMQKENISLPELSARDMVNITAYLFSVKYFDPAGDWNRGQKIFTERKCNHCHPIRGKEEKGIGPDLSKLQGKVSPILIATALWNHGPKMLEKMKEENIPWKEATTQEVVDIMEFLNNPK